MTKRVFKLEELTWTEVDALDRSRTAVFLLSSPIEQHGPHLPLGTDLLEAGAVLRAVARRVVRAGWTVLLAPPLPYTTAVLSREFPGSTSVRAGHLEGFFTDVVASFATNGFANVVVFSQHLDPPHVLAWERACAEASAAGARAIEGYERLVLDDLRSGALDSLFGNAGVGDSHAGLFETSMVLAVRPRLVRRQVAAMLPPAPIDFERELRSAHSFRDVGDGQGYTGSPADASAHLGRRLIRRYAHLFGDLVLEHLAGVDVRWRLSVSDLFPPGP
jgi:creatinine amidohydrolase